MIKIYQNRCDEKSTDGHKHVKFIMMLGAKNWESHFAQYYLASCEVDTDDLEDAFELTNLWNDIDKVKFLNGRCPSSSVGDLFVIGDQCFIVDIMGFAQVPYPSVYFG